MLYYIEAIITYYFVNTCTTVKSNLFRPQKSWLKPSLNILMQYNLKASALMIRVLRQNSWKTCLYNRAVSSAFSRLDREAKCMGLSVNEDKTKYLLSSIKQSSYSRLGWHVTVDRHNFEIVDNFDYFQTSINTNNNISLKIIHSITFANRCYFGLSRQLKSKVLSRWTKSNIYKSLIIRVLLNGAEAWTMRFYGRIQWMGRWAVKDIRRQLHNSANQETAATLAR